MRGLIDAPATQWLLFGVPAGPLVALIVANLLPLVGVIALGWDARGVLLLYWAENLIVAIWSYVRMLYVGGWIAIPRVIFFCIHFGIFMMVHLMFIIVLTADWSGDGPDPFDEVLGGEFLTSVSWWALAALFISHGISFFRNFIGNGEWERTTVDAQMVRPYPRMILMHVSIIAAGWFFVLLGSGMALLIILVLLKTLADAAAHVREHRPRTPDSSDATPAE
jgi:hypothetical protein